MLVSRLLLKIRRNSDKKLLKKKSVRKLLSKQWLYACLLVFVRVGVVAQCICSYSSICLLTCISVLVPVLVKSRSGNRRNVLPWQCPQGRCLNYHFKKKEKKKSIPFDLQWKKLVLSLIRGYLWRNRNTKTLTNFGSNYCISQSSSTIMCNNSLPDQGERKKKLCFC